MGTLEGMISKCESMLGTSGTPNKATQWYGDRNGRYFRNAPWCNMFITWAAYHTDNYQAVCFGTDYAYTVWHAQRFQRVGRWHVDTAGIKRGDIVFFDWAGSNSVGAIDHVGIVTDVKGPAVYTIEGNTDNRCARRVRYASDIVGYGRPDYDKAPPSTGSGQRTHAVVSGDTLWDIARTYGVTVTQLRQWNGLNTDLILVGDVLYVAELAEAPKPKPRPEPVGYQPPPFPQGLDIWKKHPSAKAFQRALKAAGYMPWWVWLSDTYDQNTINAVVKFHKKNPQFASSGHDPRIGPLGWAHLHREAYDK